MSFSVTDWFVQQYSQGVHTLVQQETSRLRKAVEIESVVGKTAFTDRIGIAEAVKRTTRHGDSPLVSTPHSRRMLTLVDYEWGDLIDQQDKVRTLNDPTNPYSRAAAMAMGRAMDDEIILAATGTAKAGEDGATDVTFPAAQQVAVGAANLQLAKIISTAELLNQQDAPSEDRWFVVGSSQIADIMADTTITSADFNSMKILMEGGITSFMGFNWIRSERLNEVAATNVRSCLAFHRSAIKLGIGMEPRARIEERADKSFATYVYFAMSIGAVRLEEERIVEVLCDEDL